MTGAPQPPLAPDWRPGVYPHGVDFTSDISSPFGFLTTRLVARLRQTSAQSIPNTSWTAINWTTADEDAYGGFSSAKPSIYTMQAPGTYLATGTIWLSGSTTANNTTASAIGYTPSISFYTAEQLAPTDGSPYAVPAIALSYYTIGSVVSLFVYQASGSAMNTATGTGQQSTLDLYWVGA
jgi:hypothetical protein